MEEIGIIEVKTNYFLKLVIEKLKIMHKNSIDIDDSLYGKEEMHKEWTKIRDINLELGDLLDGIDHYM
jgi:hypothetical protein